METTDKDRGSSRSTGSTASADGSNTKPNEVTTPLEADIETPAKPLDIMWEEAKEKLAEKGSREG